MKKRKLFITLGLAVLLAASLFFIKLLSTNPQASTVGPYTLTLSFGNLGGGAYHSYYANWSPRSAEVTDLGLTPPLIPCKRDANDACQAVINNTIVTCSASGVTRECLNTKTGGRAAFNPEPKPLCTPTLTQGFGKCNAPYHDGKVDCRVEDHPELNYVYWECTASWTKFTVKPPQPPPPPPQESQPPTSNKYANIDVTLVDEVTGKSLPFRDGTICPNADGGQAYYDPIDKQYLNRYVCQYNRPGKVGTTPPYRIYIGGVIPADNSYKIASVTPTMPLEVKSGTTTVVFKATKKVTPSSPPEPIAQCQIPAQLKNGPIRSSSEPVINEGYLNYLPIRQIIDILAPRVYSADVQLSKLSVTALGQSRDGTLTIQTNDKNGDICTFKIDILGQTITATPTQMKLGQTVTREGAKYAFSVVASATVRIADFDQKNGGKVSISINAKLYAGTDKKTRRQIGTASGTGEYSLVRTKNNTWEVRNRRKTQVITAISLIAKMSATGFGIDINPKTD